MASLEELDDVAGFDDGNDSPKRELKDDRHNVDNVDVNKALRSLVVINVVSSFTVCVIAGCGTFVVGPGWVMAESLWPWIEATL